MYMLNILSQSVKSVGCSVELSYHWSLPGLGTVRTCHSSDFTTGLPPGLIPTMACHHQGLSVPGLIASGARHYQVLSLPYGLSQSRFVYATYCQYQNLSPSRLVTAKNVAKKYF